jgi:glycosyltransferase involved in cell wall biosynthesis
MTNYSAADRHKGVAVAGTGDTSSVAPVAGADRRSADVTVIVPTYNRAHFLAEALESILDQTRSPREVIVVDDGSTDDTPAIAKAFGERIQYVRKHNEGKAAAVNFALGLAQGEHVIIADDDDLMCPAALERLLVPLESDPLVDFAHGGLSFFRDSPGRGRFEVGAPPITVAETGHHFEALLMNYSIAHNTTLVRRRCYDVLGGLDESFRRSEDYEFMLRLTRQFRGITVPARIVSVRRHEGERGDAGLRHSARARQLVHFDFDARAFEALRRDVPLGAYVGKTHQPLSRKETFDAWLVRAATMARHGVWLGFSEDIRECARHRTRDAAALSRPMASKLTAVFSRSDTIEAGLREPGYPHSIVKEFIGAIGASAVRPIVRGFYYAAREAWEDGSRWLALRCLGFAFRTVFAGLIVTRRQP